MDSSCQVGVRQVAVNLEEHQDGLGCCARLWNRLVAALFSCSPRLLEWFTIADRTPNQNIRQRTVERTAQSNEPTLQQTQFVGSTSQSVTGVGESIFNTEEALTDESVELTLPSTDMIHDQFVMPDTKLPPKVSCQLGYHLNQRKYHHLCDRDLILETLNYDAVEGLFRGEGALRGDTFVKRYLLFLELKHSYPRIDEKQMPLFIALFEGVDVQKYLDDSVARDDYYHTYLSRMSQVEEEVQAGLQQLPATHRRISPQKTSDISTDDVNYQYSPDYLVELVKANLSKSQYKKVKLNDSELRCALDPSRVELLLTCFEPAFLADTFIIFLLLREDYPQLNFDCFKQVPFEFFSNRDSSINIECCLDNAGARRKFFESKLKNNKSIMELGGYRHTCLHHNRLSELQLLAINDKCYFFQKEFILNQELFDVLINSVADNDLKNIEPDALADQIECFVRLNCMVDSTDDNDLTNPYKFNIIRTLLPRHLNMLRRKDYGIIDNVCAALARSLQEMVQVKEDDKKLQDVESKTDSLQIKLKEIIPQVKLEEKSPDESLQNSLHGQKVETPEELIDRTLCEQFNEYLLAYNFEDIDMNRVKRFSDRIEGNNIFKIKYVILFLLCQRANSELTDECFDQLIRTKALKRLSCRVKLSGGRKVICDIHFKIQLSDDDLSLCADKLLESLRDSSQEEGMVERQEGAAPASCRGATSSDYATPRDIEKSVKKYPERGRKEELDFLKQELALEMNAWRREKVRAMEELRELKISPTERGRRKQALEATNTKEDKLYTVLSKNSHDELPFVEQSNDQRVMAKLVTGVQANNNNCCFASLIVALNSQGVLGRMIEVAEGNPNASSEVIETLRLLTISSDDDFISNRHLEKLRQLLNHPHGVTRDMMEILDVLLHKLDIRTWNDSNFVVSSNIASPIQYVQLNVADEDPFFDGGGFQDLPEKPIEELIEILYRSTLAVKPREENEDNDAWVERVSTEQNLRGWPTEEKVITDTVNTPRKIWKEQVRKAELKIDQNNKPEIILVTYPLGFHGFIKPINNKVVLKGDSEDPIIYDVVSMTSIERSHYYAWAFDQKQNRVTFHDSMADQIGGHTCLPCTVTAQGILGDKEREKSMFVSGAITPLKNYRNSSKPDYNMCEKFERLPKDVSLVVLKLQSVRENISVPRETIRG